MERNANYALVGLISAIIFVGLLVFIVWLAGSGFSRKLDTYDIIFKGPVRGLSQGAEVHFNGIKVGDVSRIYLDPKDATLVVAEARITSDVPVRQDSVGTLEPQGITGVTFVQISAGTARKPLLKDVTPEGQVPLIHTKVDALSNLLAGGGDIVQRAVESLDRVNRVLSDQNIKSFGLTLANLKDFSGELAKLADAATEIEASAKSLKGMVDNLKGPTTEFATTGLPQMTNAIISLQRATEHVDQMIGQIQNNPRGLVAKPPAKEIEVKP